MNKRKFRPGDRVFVRPPEEILSTLDADGTLNGIPFMPEMLPSCGKQYRVLRLVDKTCVDGDPIRHFPGNDVVVLDSPRCDGSAHDGCMRGCRIFWKEAWLQSANDAHVASEAAGLDRLRARLKVKSDETHYFCQSTQIKSATEPDRRRFRTFRIAFREIIDGDLSILRASKLFALWIWTKSLRAMGADERLRGPGKRMANEPLGLEPGDVVRVKSRAGVVETLSRKRSNRGLGVCYEMTRCCGRDAEVRFRVDRLINESTGEMRDISNTVTLASVGGSKARAEECLCWGELGDCPRGELMYWREVWLERR
jgi:hypothetical protein